MNERDNGDDAVFPRRDRLRDFAKCERNKQNDTDRDKRERDQALAQKFLPDDRPDGVELVFVDEAERGERLLERIFLVGRKVTLPQNVSGLPRRLYTHITDGRALYRGTDLFHRG